MIKKIKEMYSCRKIVERYGYEIKNSGKDSCNFTYPGCGDGSSARIWDKTDSWHVFREDIKAGGDVINLAMFLSNQTFNEVFVELGTECGALKDRDDIPLHIQRKYNFYSTMSTIAKVANRALLEDSNIDKLKAIKSRGLSDSTIKRFRLGWVSRELGYQFAKEFGRELLENCGLFSDGEFSLSGRFIIPMTYKNQIQWLQGWNPSSRAKYKSSKKPQVTGIKRVPFGLDTILEKMPVEDVILCEGVFDALSAYESGYAAIAACGTSLSKGNYDTISDLIDTRPLFIVSDYDENGAGKKAALKHIDSFFLRHVTTYCCLLQPSMLGFEMPRQDNSNALPVTISTEELKRYFGFCSKGEANNAFSSAGISTKSDIVNANDAITKLREAGYQPVQALPSDGILSWLKGIIGADIKKMDLNMLWTASGMQKQVIDKIIEVGVDGLLTVLQSKNDSRSRNRNAFLKQLESTLLRYPQLTESHAEMILVDMGLRKKEIKQVMKNTMSRKGCKVVSYAHAALALKHIEYHKNHGLLTYKPELGIWKNITQAEWTSFLRSKVVPSSETVSGRVVPDVLTELTGLTYRDDVRSMADSLRYVVTNNGVLDIELNKLYSEFDPKYHALSKINANYSESAECPRFHEFLKEIFLLPCDEGDEQKEKEMELKRKSIYEMIGLFCVPDNSFKRFWTLVGASNAGKSILTRIILELLGEENVSALSVEQLGQGFTINSLNGKLLNLASENEAAVPKATTTETVKKITGGNPIEIRRLYSEAQQHILPVRFLFEANRPIQWPDTSSAMVNRQKDAIYQFPVVFHEHPSDVQRKMDKHLLPKLLKEIDGIFSRSIKAYKDLIARGTMVAIDQYSQDVLMESIKTAEVEQMELFLEQHVKFTKTSKDYEKVSDLFKLFYKPWFMKHSLMHNYKKAMSQSMFNHMLERYVVSIHEPQEGYKRPYLKRDSKSRGTPLTLFCAKASIQSL